LTGDHISHLSEEIYGKKSKKNHGAPRQIVPQSWVVFFEKVQKICENACCQKSLLNIFGGVHGPHNPSKNQIPAATIAGARAI